MIKVCNEQEILKRNPLVSVIIPVYNGEKYLRETIKTVLNQSYKNIEILAVNDGSTDSSIDILKQFESQLCIINQTNSGQAAARNNGISHAKGEWIAFLDQDDLWDQEKLAMQIKQIHEKDAVIHTGARIIDNHGTNIGNVPVPKESELTLESLILRNPIITSSVLVRRQSILEIGMLDSENRFGTDDYDLWMVLLATGHDFKYLPQKLTSYRLHGDNMSSNNPKLCDGKLHVLSRISTRFPDAFGKKENKALKRRIFDIDIQVGMYYMRNEKYFKASESFSAAIRKKPLKAWVWLLLIINKIPYKERIIPFIRKISQMKRKIIGMLKLEPK